MPEAPTPRTPSAWAAPIAWLAVAIASGASARTRVLDGDLFWHLRAGEWIARHHAIPHLDPFSYTAHGPWRYTDALAELFFFGLERLGGVGAVVVGAACVVGVTTLLLGCLARASRVEGTGGALVAVALASAASHFRFGPKTDVFSFAAFAALLGLLARAEHAGRPRAAWAKLAWTAPLLALWGNLHRGGTLGLAMIALAALAWAIDRNHRALVLPALAALAAGALALTLNAGGVGYLLSAFDLMRRSSFRALLPEWAPMPASFPLVHDPALFALFVAFALGLARRRRLDREALVALVAIALAIRAVRFVPLAAIAMVPDAARALSRLLGGLEKATSRHLRAGAAARTLAAGALAAAIAIAPLLALPASRRGTGVLAWRLPVGAAAFLRAHPPPGRMWNDFDFGGYLMWAVPDEPVFIDGRNDTVYSDAFFAATMRAASDPDALRRQLDRWDVGFAVVKCTALADAKLAWLATDRRFELVYLDDLVAVIVRRSAASEGYLAAFGYAELRPADAIARAARLDRDPRRGELEREIARDVAEAPDSIRAHVLAGLVARANGDEAARAAHAAAIERLANERGIVVAAP